MTVAQWTRMLRRPDEISYRALIVGMARYKPDVDKALHYAGQAVDAVNWRRPA